MDDEAVTAAESGFEALGLDARLVKTLGDLGYEEPTPIQRAAIPMLLTGVDLIGQAATGTGKTAAFALPILQRISGLGKDRGHPAALILVPTRELAMQVAEAMHKYGQRLKLTTIPIYGGHSFGQQQRMLDRGVDVVVATPGRALDHIRRSTMNVAGISILALDEADEMLDMGFADDLDEILAQTPEQRQTIFFSATIPPRIAGMARKHLKDPQRVEIAKEKTAKGEAPKVRQTAYIIPRQRKLEVLGRVLDLENPASALVFCRMRWEVDELTERLSAHGYRAQALHGGVTQDQRSRVVRRLREGQIDLVVATDVAARGLDIENLELVVNYDVPVSPESYTHRIGRVGRAGREGVAVTLADPREARLLKLFERATNSRIEIAQVPSDADLRARRLESLRAELADVVASEGLEEYRSVVQSLAQEHDLMNVALAAVKMAHHAKGGSFENDDGPPEPSVDRGGDRGERSERGEREPRRDASPHTSNRRGPDGPARADVRRRGPGRGHPAAGPRRRDHRRGGADGRADRRDRDRGSLLDRRAAGVGDRPRDQGDCQLSAQGPARRGAAVRRAVIISAG